jgi:hypothetical protein
MKFCGWLMVSAMVVAVPAAYGQGFGGMLDRLGNSMEKKVTDRVDQDANKAADSALDKTEDAVGSAAQGANDAAKPQPAAANVAKCLATDTACLSKAKANGQMVEIVSEEELDTLRCSSTDTACLQRAKQLHKKVELTD